MGTPAVAAAAWLSKPPSRKINLGIGGWRVFITHVQHYKAEIEPESYSAIVIDLFSPRKVWLLVLLTSLLGIGRVMAVQHCDNLVHTVLCLSSVNILL